MPSAASPWGGVLWRERVVEGSGEEDRRTPGDEDGSDPADRLGARPRKSSISPAIGIQIDADDSVGIDKTQQESSSLPRRARILSGACRRADESRRARAQETLYRGVPRRRPSSSRSLLDPWS
jgi:hypothetical protein